LINSTQVLTFFSRNPEKEINEADKSVDLENPSWVVLPNGFLLCFYLSPWQKMIEFDSCQGIFFSNRAGNKNHQL